MSNLSTLRTCLQQLATRWRRDERGLAAVEFAMIVPLMLVMFFGMIDVSTGLAIDRKVTMVAQSLSDLTSRYITITEKDFTNFFNIADAMLVPYPAASMKATITQVYIDPVTATGKVQWSRGDVVRNPGSEVIVNPDLIAKDATMKVLPSQYLILSEVTYTYKPTIGWVVPKAGIDLSETTYTRPRMTNCVVIVSGNCGTKTSP